MRGSAWYPRRARHDVQQLARLKRDYALLREEDYALLREEHELLKKAIRFCSAQGARSSRSSRRSRIGSA